MKRHLSPTLTLMLVYFAVLLILLCIGLLTSCTARRYEYQQDQIGAWYLLRKDTMYRYPDNTFVMQTWQDDQHCMHLLVEDSTSSYLKVGMRVFWPRRR